MAAERAKSVRKAKEERLRATGDEEGIRRARKTKPKAQEQVFDDCGSDVTPLEKDELIMHLALSSSAFLGDLCVHCFAPDNFDHHYPTPHDNNDHPINMASLLGSDADDCQAAFYAKPDCAVFVPMETLMSYLSQSELAGDVDIMEI